MQCCFVREIGANRGSPGFPPLSYRNNQIQIAFCCEAEQAWWGECSVLCARDRCLTSDTALATPEGYSLEVRSRASRGIDRVDQPG